MKSLRHHVISKIFAAVTGLLFLNMSFFLTEIRILNLDLTKNQLINIVKMISGIGFEEEKDSMADSNELSTGDDFPDLFIVNNDPSFLNYIDLNTKLDYFCFVAFFESTHREIITPPPQLG
jgi:hypothetical protein